jgi:hypothetical protein
VPVFRKRITDFDNAAADRKGLYLLQKKGADSVFLKRYREAKFEVRNWQVRLLWVNNEIEVYTMRKKDRNGELSDADFIIVRGVQVDTVFTPLNGYYQSDYEPFAITEDRKTLFAVQPEGNQDENMRWYYDSIMKIDLTKTPLTVERLPIKGIEMQRIGNFLYYKGGEGEIQKALLRVKIPEWTKVDTLLKFVDFWFVKDSVVYAQMGGYVGQDEWLYKYGNTTAIYVAYSINSRRCAIISKDKPPCSYIHPILFEGEFCSAIRKGLITIETPTITEFPYKQTLVRSKEKK